MSISIQKVEPSSPSSSAVPAEVSITDHMEAVRPHHRFKSIRSGASVWDLSHLAPYAFQLDPGLGFDITVVVLFSCHCFTRSLSRDGRPRKEIPLHELFDNGREMRVLCEHRYALSRQFLPALIRELGKRAIQVARADPLNFSTSESLRDSSQPQRHYVVFFEIFRDMKRKRRLLLQVQSAYAIDAIDKRTRQRRKVSFATLLRATVLGHKIKD